MTFSSMSVSGHYSIKFHYYSAKHISGESHQEDFLFFLEGEVTASV